MTSAVKIFSIAATGFLVLSGAAQAVTLDATTWLNADDPIKENQSGTSTTGDGFVTIHGNGDLAVVTDFTVAPGFDFSGTVMAPEDDDILGWVFGYEDGFNNFRISWTGGEDHDWEAGPRFGGLMLVEEDAGVTDVLFREPNLLWTAGTAYDFSLSVTEAEIAFLLQEDGSDLGYWSVLGDFSGINGQVGVFTRSNGASFYNLSDVPLSSVPVPPALPMLLGGAGALFLLGRRRKS